ncbi:MAG: diaminopimelate epimerase [Gammaproteobacteria bacterium]
MRLEFTKMHGLGNDFVVIDATRSPPRLSPDQLRHLADRRFGVGCDQILLVEAPTRADTDFLYRIYNADGGEVEQCGNGARAFVRFVHERGLTPKTTIRVETAAGIIEPTLNPDGSITVDMGAPVLEPAKIPFDAPARAASYVLQHDNQALSIGAVSMGNPHAVLWVDDVDDAPVERWGPALERHPRFPNRVNVGFGQIIDRGLIRLRVFERGAGETLACGTGACAAVVAAHVQGHVDNRVTVRLRGGELSIEWAGADHPVLMTGPAEIVYQGEIEL